MISNRRGCASPEEMPVKAKSAAVVVCLCLVAFLAPAAAFCTTLEEKTGQMIMVGFRGTAVDDAPAVADDIEAGRIDRSFRRIMDLKSRARGFLQLPDSRQNDRSPEEQRK